jgi:hypothetical protein
MMASSTPWPAGLDEDKAEIYFVYGSSIKRIPDIAETRLDPCCLCCAASLRHLRQDRPDRGNPTSLPLVVSEKHRL